MTTLRSESIDPLDVEITHALTELLAGPIGQAWAWRELLGKNAELLAGPIGQAWAWRELLGENGEETGRDGEVSGDHA
jgi:hypothetical protein